MPIRIIRDDSPEYTPEDAGDLQTIVVSGSQERAEDQKPADEAPSMQSQGPPVQTTWAMVNGQCTMTRSYYQLAFRREGETFVLKSVDPNVSSSASKDMSGVEGPFDWAAFACPGCGRDWGRADASEAPWPVIVCSCASIFCTRKGAYNKGGKGGDDWWWSCSRCGVDARVKMGVDSIEGQALKGK